MKIYAFALLALFTGFMAFGQVTVQTNIPPSLAPGDYLLEVKLNKGGISNFAKYQMDVPAGVTIGEGDSRTGNFTFDDGRAKIVWVTIPTEAEFVMTFKMNVSNTSAGTFNHKFYYLSEEGKKEVEFEPINVTFDASGAKSLASLGGKASADPNEKTAKTTATITTSGGEVTGTTSSNNSNSSVSSNNGSNSSNTSTEPVKSNNETAKTNAESSKTNSESGKTTEPVKTNTDPVVKSNTKEETKPVETAKTTNTSSSSNSSGLVFKVQIGAYGENPSPALFKGLTDKVTVVKEGGFYKALVGKFDTKEEAVAKINELKGQGFQGFLVRYQGGVRVK